MLLEKTEFFTVKLGIHIYHHAFKKLTDIPFTVVRLLISKFKNQEEWARKGFWYSSRLTPVRSRSEKITDR
jgi:hypothetical protein